MENHESQVTVDRAGIFRAKPISWTLKVFNTGSQAIKVQYGIIEQWDGQGWNLKYPPGYCAYASHFILKKNDGGPNEFAVRQLIESGLWDGDLDRLQGDPPDITVIVTTKEETGNDGKVYHPVDWLEVNADAPGERKSGFAPADPSAIASTKARFGSQFRAIAGTVKPATGQPTPPPPMDTPPGAVPPPAQIQQQQPVQQTQPQQTQQESGAAPPPPPPAPGQSQPAQIDLDDTPF